jgi:hypothetical protein
MALATATAMLTPKPVKLGPVSKGQIPAGARLLLGVPDATNAIDVTHQKNDHLIDERNLSRFLALIGNARWWGTKGRCRLFLKSGTSIAPTARSFVPCAAGKWRRTGLSSSAAHRAAQALPPCRDLPSRVNRVPERSRNGSLGSVL